MNWVVARLKEPSTWAGFGTVLNAGVATAFPSISVYAGALATIFGAIAVCLKEAAAPPG